MIPHNATYLMEAKAEINQSKDKGVLASPILPVVQ